MSDNAVVKAASCSDQLISIQHCKEASPIHKIPSELLLLIFAFHVATLPKDCDVPPQPRMSEGPWLLSTVCSRWRNLVVCTAEFWVNIRFVFRDIMGMTDADWIRTTELASLQLSRSQDLPLCIYAKSLLSPPNEATSLCERRLLSEFFLHHRRWRIVELVEPTLLFYNCLHTIASSPIECPLLEHFTVGVPRTDDEGYPRLFATPQGCPSLTSAKIRVNERRRLAKYTHLPWAQLQHLILENMWNLEHLPSVIPKMHNLTILELIFQDSKEPAANPQRPNPIAFPSLKTLRVLGPRFRPERVISVFTVITAPALEHLVMGPTKDHDIPEIKSFITRSNCSLRSFLVLPRRLDLILPLLKTMNALQDFLVDLRYNIDLNSDKSLAKALSCVENGSFSHCPQLRRLSLFRFYYIPQVTRDLLPLLDMLDRRSDAAQHPEGSDGYPFTAQVVDLCNANWDWEIADEDAGRISALRNRGMDISIRSRDRDYMDRNFLPTTFS